MAELLLFGEADGAGGMAQAALAAQMAAQRLEDERQGSGGAEPSGQSPIFDVGREYLYQECLYGAEGRPVEEAGRPGDAGAGEGRHHGRRPPWLGE